MKTSVKFNTDLGLFDCFYKFSTGNHFSIEDSYIFSYHFSQEKIYWSLLGADEGTLRKVWAMI